MRDDLRDPPQICPESYNARMPTCMRCGERNVENATICAKCGVALSHQYRADKDAQRAKIHQAVRAVSWVAVLIVLIIIGPSVFRQGKLAYLKYHLKSVTSAVMMDCDGPVTDSTPSYERPRIEKCIDGHQELKDAQKEYDDYAKS